ncbi:MAG: hypothetical protein N3F09_08495 [Bacteroidia bacterium]|nr:hypothetical protein [Bacteroidia bacterium]
MNSTVGNQSPPRVLVEFQIAKGPTCPGYVIYHSSDSIFFYPIHNYSGICGDINNDQNVSFLHGSPIYNSNNYYKVELVATETSPVKRIYVGEALVSGGVYVYPNPCKENNILTLRFLNINSDRDFYGKIVSLQGFRDSEFFGKSIGMELKVSLSGISRGAYVMWLTDGFEIYRTKVIVNE